MFYLKLAKKEKENKTVTLLITYLKPNGKYFDLQYGFDIAPVR